MENYQEQQKKEKTEILRKNKTSGYEEPTLWLKYSKLASKTKSVNLGQGFPDWNPPSFFLESLQNQIINPCNNHQYTRGPGIPKLIKVIAKNYSPIYKREIDPMTEVLVANGAVSLLYNLISALINEGDEIITLEGFYDCYTPQVKFAGGKLVGIPLIPPKIREKSEYQNLIGNLDIKIKDRWLIDMEKLEKAFNEKTRILILNTPHNPSGKIITYDEMLEIKKILDKWPDVVVLMDEVYEKIIYDEYEELPRFASIEGMWDRTVSIMSAGKTFSATGIRLAWAIGAKDIIIKAVAIYQYNSFCIYEPLQLALAETMEIAELPYEGYENYYKYLRGMYMYKRNYFIEKLSAISSFDLPFWLPEGGYFVVCDISRKTIISKFCFEGEEDKIYTRDFNFTLNLAHEKKVIGIACSAFYTQEHVRDGEKFIRLAYCKKDETLDQALENLSKLI